MQVNDLWPALKNYLGMGATGATAVLMTLLWLRGNRRNDQINEIRVQTEKDHNKEMMKLQADNAKDMVTLVRQYDQTLSDVNKTLDRLVSKEE